MDDNFVIAKVKNKRIKIPLGLKRPKFKDFNSFEQWILEERAFANALRRRLEGGEKLPHTIEKEMIDWSKRTIEVYKIRETLNTEKLILHLDMKIKLALKKGSIDTKRCLVLLKMLKHLNMTSLMLKKHPEIVKTVERLTRFRGKLSEEKQVKKINKYGYRILKKMSRLFNVPKHKSFLEVFNEEKDAFYRCNLHLDISGINMLFE